MMSPLGTWLTVSAHGASASIGSSGSAGTWASATVGMSAINRTTISQAAFMERGVVRDRTRHGRGALPLPARADAMMGHTCRAEQLRDQSAAHGPQLKLGSIALGEPLSDSIWTSTEVASLQAASG